MDEDLALVMGDAGVGDASPPWFRALVGAIDSLEPGLAMRLLRASQPRRHVVATCLAVALDKTTISSCRAPDDETLRADGELRGLLDRIGGPSQLLAARPRTLLAMALGDCPSGFAPAVQKVGPELGKPAFYRWLFKIFIRTKHQALARLLTRLNVIDLHKLAPMRRLPRDLLTPRFIDEMSPKNLRLINHVVPVLRKLARDATEDDWSASYREFARHHKIHRFAKFWLKRIPAAAPPVEGDEFVRPLQSGEEIVQASRTHRNCMRSMVVDVLRRHRYFYDSRLLDIPVIVELNQDAVHGWGLVHVHGVRNEDVPHEVTRANEDWFEARGIGPVGLSEHDWSVLESLWYRALL